MTCVTSKSPTLVEARLLAVDGGLEVVEDGVSGGGPGGGGGGGGGGPRGVGPRAPRSWLSYTSQSSGDFGGVRSRPRSDCDCASFRIWSISDPRRAKSKTSAGQPLASSRTPPSESWGSSSSNSASPSTPQAVSNLPSSTSSSFVSSESKFGRFVYVRGRLYTKATQQQSNAAAATDTMMMIYSRLSLVD